VCYVVALALVCSASRAVGRDGKQVMEMPFFTQHSLCKITVYLRYKCPGKVSGKYMSGILLGFM